MNGHTNGASGWQDRPMPQDHPLPAERTSTETTPPTRRTKGKNREELIVEAATQVITERGLANVRIADVAHVAGMTPGHVTYYFPSKTELLVRSIVQSEAAFTDQVEAQVQAVADPWQRLERYFSRAGASKPADRGWVLWIEVWSLAANDPQVAQVQQDLDARSRRILADIIRYGVELEAFSCPDPEETAQLLNAVIDGLSIQLTLGVSEFDGAGLVELCLIAARRHLTVMP
jgi:AcrR family transcriptional regulator